jgi:uncharacterized protein YwlG (UPF0340 family)
MNWLGKMFKKKQKSQPIPALKVCIVDTTTSDLYTTLGITDERRDELLEFVYEGFNRFDSKSDSLKYIVDRCNHVNEVLVCVIVFERKCSMHDNPIAQLLKGL